MHWRSLILVVGLLAVVAWSAPPGAAETVEGVLDAEPPAALEGDLGVRVAEPTLWIQNPEPGAQQTPLVLDAENLTVTHKVYEIRTARAESPLGNTTVVGPGPEYSAETYTVENATIEVTGLGPDADVVLGPGEDAPLVASADGPATALADARPQGMEVLDGYREEYGFNESDEESRFNYAYTVDHPLVSLQGAPALDLDGSAHGYVWDAHVLVRNETRTIATYDTGASEQSRTDGTTHERRFEYVTIEARGVDAHLPPEVGPLTVLDRGLQAHLDGELRLPGAAGALTGEEGVYEAAPIDEAWLAGNLSATLTPAGAAGEAGFTVGIEGDLASTNLPLSGDAIGVSSKTVVAAGASGATVLGAAAWYLFAGKGASLAVLGALRREEDEVEAPPVESPHELLFDPDRFALYHLVRSRPGLSADQCEQLAGIEDAPRELELLAEHGLLKVLATGPDRYCVPGTVDEEHAEDIVFLQDPEAKRLAELLAVHGLTPEAKLLERARNAAPISVDRVPALIDAFVERGLAYREPGDEDMVIDPTDRLFACFEAMGEGSMPRAS